MCLFPSVNSDSAVELKKRLGVGGVRYRGGIKWGRWIHSNIFSQKITLLYLFDSIICLRVYIFNLVNENHDEEKWDREKMKWEKGESENSKRVFWLTHLSFSYTFSVLTKLSVFTLYLVLSSKNKSYEGCFGHFATLLIVKMSRGKRIL